MNSTLMQAAYRERYCAPADLKVKELPRPVPGAKELLVRVCAATVNRTDCAVLAGSPFVMRFVTGLFRPRLAVPGTDFAGVVEAVGDRVTKYKPGDRIWGFHDHGIGSQAQYFTLSEKTPMLPLPANLDFAQAVACAEAAHYAINFLNKVKLAPGQRVMVNGATGGIGVALLQLVKAQGLYVCATCETANIGLIQSLGADRVIDYTRTDFTQDQEQYDFVFDAVGKSTFGKCKRLLGPRGIYISSELGPGAQNIFWSLWTPLFSKKKVKFPIPTNIPASMARIQSEVEQGRFRPVIDRHYPLNQIAEAYEYVASGRKIGNVVIEF